MILFCVILVQTIVHIQISFLEGRDGVPYVVTINDDIKVREEEQARKEADRIRQEAEELAKHFEKIAVTSKGTKIFYQEI